MLKSVIRYPTNCIVNTHTHTKCYKIALNIISCRSLKLSQRKFYEFYRTADIIVMVDSEADCKYALRTTTPYKTFYFKKVKNRKEKNE